MTHVITQSCCIDASCIDVCPVQCIRPRPGDAQFTSAEQLYIDPDICIDCGACLDVCPVDAIEVDYYLPRQEQPYLRINAEYFTRHPIEDATPLAVRSHKLPEGRVSLRVAIIGAGAAGCYAAAALLELSGVSISMFERLPSPHGLARAGVAPDHHKTRGIGALFDTVLARPEVTCFFNVEVGRDVTLAELTAHHHAIIWSAGATSDRRLGIPGEDLPGCHSAREFVGWYNGHPDHAGLSMDLNGAHVVIIGNGNVAIDAARMLVCDVGDLDRTDMAHHAIAALEKSGVRDVTIAARRGPEAAAYSLSELLALTYLKGVSLVTRAEEVNTLPRRASHDALKLEIAAQAAVPRPLADRRINLRYFMVPVSIDGDDRVEAITFTRYVAAAEGDSAQMLPTGETETIKTSLVLRAIGYRGLPIPGLPFDEASGTIVNLRGRVMDPVTSTALTGYYCAGWIKRGATGVLGANKRCSAETVNTLLDDLAAGLLPAPAKTEEHFKVLMAGRVPHILDFAAWSRINAAELLLGKSRGRSRSKFVTLGDMLGAAIAGQ